MADPRAFISFDFDNNQTDKNLFAGQCSRSSPTPFSAQDWSSKHALPQRQWEDIIYEKVGRCHMMFVLVSPTAYTAVGVEKEIQMAVDQNIPFCGVYIAGAGPLTRLPSSLPRNRTIRWDWQAIASAVDQMLKEGRNS